jgi:hypothetical protein
MYSISPTTQVKLGVFWAYCKATGICAISFSFFLFGLYQVASAWSNFWLTDWSQDTYLTNSSNIHTQQYKNKKDYYLVGFGLFGIVQGGFLI